MKKIFVVIIIVGCIAAIFGYYQYNRKSTGIEKVNAAFQLTADSLYNSYETNEDIANKKYLGKIIEISGEVQSFSKDENNSSSVTLKTNSGMFGVICRLDSSFNKGSIFAEGEHVVMKGICTGMLMDVVLIKCITVSK